MISWQRANAEGPLTFEEHVRPILKAHCFQCHGEEEEHEGSLDLRLVRLIAKGGDSGPAIVAGKVEESLLVQRLLAGEMPPEGKGKRLSDKQIATIRAWVEQGATTARPEPSELAEVSEVEKEFWSFQPIRRPEAPKVQGPKSKVQSPIDAFLLAELGKRELGFSPEADKTTLIRRATFDLLGLPPWPEEVDAYLAETSPDAWERLVDRLLASPRYGERWGRHWLDVAGYADSDGYTEKDPERKYAYKYRDYVIRAFNADKPWDVFIREQLAGDELLAPPYKNLTAEQADLLAATGFLRMAPDGTADNAVDQSAARNDVIAETIKIASSSLLGLTVGCAQCHNHRYDPIPQADYYRWRAIFEPAYDTKNWRKPTERLVSLWTDEVREQAAAVDADLKKLAEERLAEMDKIVASIFDAEVAKLPEEKRELARQAKAAAVKDQTPEQKQILKDHPSLNVSRGSAYLYEKKRVDELAKTFDARQKELQGKRPAEDFVPCLTEPVEKAPQTFVFFRGDINQPRQEVEPGELAVLGRVQGSGFRVQEARSEVRGQRSEGIDQAIGGDSGVHSTQYSVPSSDSSSGAALLSNPRFNPGASGQNLKYKISSAIPLDDPALPTTGRRLAYAKWLTSGEHPLVARVLVNRFWMHHFGKGIVATPADFGVLGERPSHPELLDWLASQFVSDGWELKRLHRMVMGSTAYRQSSKRTSALDAIDADNRLLGRMSVRRLEAEAVRDSILAASGALNVKMQGPPVPVTVDEVGQVIVGLDNRDSAGRPVTKRGSLSGEEFRRSVYVQVRRSQPLSMLETFDAPALNPNCEIRNRSTVAPQSLLLMNNEFVLAQADKLAQRVIAEAGSDSAERVRWAWRLSLGLEPAAGDVAQAVAFVADQEREFEATPPSDKASIRSADERALASLCQVLFSSNAFLYVD
jgi:mono/diheme cytochrome c family protein